jgi:hypothetical protein
MQHAMAAALLMNWKMLCELFTRLTYVCKKNCPPPNPINAVDPDYNTQEGSDRMATVTLLFKHGGKTLLTTGVSRLDNLPKAHSKIGVENMLKGIDFLCNEW